MMWMLALAAHPATPEPVLRRLLTLTPLERPDDPDSIDLRLFQALASNPTLRRDLLVHLGRPLHAGRTAWGRTVLGALRRPDMTARTARDLLTAADASPHDILRSYERAFRATTALAVRGEILRALVLSSSSWSTDQLLPGMLADPALTARSRLRLLKAIAGAARISDVEAIAVAWSVAHHPRHAATVVRTFNASQRTFRTTYADLRVLIDLPWLTTPPAQWTDLVLRVGQHVSRAELIAATGSHDLVAHVLDNDPTPSEARQVLKHAHLPLAMRQAAALIVRDTPNCEFPEGTLSDVLLDSDLAWSDEFLAGANELPEALAAVPLVGLSARTLERLRSTVDDTASGQMSKERIWVHLAAAGSSSNLTRAVGLDALHRTSGETSLMDMVVQMKSGPAHERGSRVLAAAEPRRRWNGIVSGDGELDHAISAFLTGAAPRLSTPTRIEALFTLAPTFTGTLGELFTAVEAVAD